MDITTLNNVEIQQFRFIHNTIFPKRKQSFQKKGILLNGIKIKLDIKSIINKTKLILDLFNKTNYDLTKTYTEFQQRNCGFEKKCRRTFNWHKDNEGVINFKVYTVIYYIRKDELIKGGNIEFIYGGKNNVQQIDNGTVLCFDGDLKHRPEICSGIGCRDSIVVFVKKTS